MLNRLLKDKINYEKSFSSSRGYLLQINIHTNYSCLNNDKDKSKNNTSLCFSHNPVNISSDGFGFTKSNIQINPRLSEGTYIIPIIADISYLSDSLKIPSTYLNQADTPFNPIQNNKQILYLTIKVESPLEQIIDWLNNVLNPISAGITTIIGITTAIVGTLAVLCCMIIYFQIHLANINQQIV